MKRPEPPFSATPDAMDEYCRTLLQHNPAREEAGRLCGLGLPGPQTLDQIGEWRGSTKQAAQSHISNHTARIADEDIKQGGLLCRGAELAIASMAWSGVGQRSTKRNRVPERTARELQRAGIVAAPHLLHLRLAALTWRLDLSALGEDLAPVAEDVREEMMIAEEPATPAELEKILEARPDAAYRLAGWPTMCFEELVRLRTGITPDPDGKYQPGPAWTEGMDPMRERVARRS